MRSDFDDQESPALDMAPLIDCVFLLLIFFLVATTMKKVEKELPLDLPEASAAIEVKNSENMLILGIDDKGKLYKGTTEITISGLESLLRETARTNIDQRIRIDGAKNADYQDVLFVLDRCTFYNLKNVGLHTRKK